MEVQIEKKPTDFADRRTTGTDERPQGLERRQFSNSHSSMRTEVAELADAVDQYKLRHRRRFITFEELFGVIEQLGYHK